MKNMKTNTKYVFLSISKFSLSKTELPIQKMSIFKPTRALCGMVTCGRRPGRCACGVHVVCGWCVSCMYRVCKVYTRMYARDMHVVCIWYERGMHVACTWWWTWYTRGAHVVCTRYARVIHVVYTWYPRGGHVVCTWCACGMYAVCTGYARGMHVVCTRYARGLHVVCLRYACDAYVPSTILDAPPQKFVAQCVHVPR